MFMRVNRWWHLGVAALSAISWALAGCSDGVPTVLESETVVSPGSQAIAVVELIDNGLGFGQGLAYSEIHVGPASFKVSSHLERTPDSTLAFLAPLYGDDFSRSSVKWMDDQNLVVTYGMNVRPNTRKQKVGDVFISYIALGGTESE